MEADKKAPEAALKQQRNAELSGFAREIRQQIVERGYTVADETSLYGWLFTSRNIPLRRSDLGDRFLGFLLDHPVPGAAAAQSQEPSLVSVTPFSTITGPSMT
jgi:hypothetical protein